MPALLWHRVLPLFVLAYGLLAFVAGWRALVSHALDEGASGGDYTGILYTLAGLVVGLALKLAADALRGRPAAAARLGRGARCGVRADGRRISATCGRDE